MLLTITLTHLVKYYPQASATDHLLLKLSLDLPLELPLDLPLELPAIRLLLINLLSYC